MVYAHIMSTIFKSNVNERKVVTFPFPSVHLSITTPLSPGLGFDFGMKIQCEVCSSSEASVFCSVDEAALCHSCDHTVHQANKLASKHQRFSLVSPLTKDVPLCDICKEKRAFLFCQQDRSILCKDCDFSIHNCNEHTQKHNRFLLTGVKLSSYVSSAASETSLTSSCDLVPDFKSVPPRKGKSDSVSMNCHRKSLAFERRVVSPCSSGVSNSAGFGNDVGISEYLIEMLPGWHVDDFLDPTSAPLAFSKGDNSMVAFSNTDFQASSFSSLPSQNAGILVPTVSRGTSASRNLIADSQSTNTSSKRSRSVWY